MTTTVAVPTPTPRPGARRPRRKRGYSTKFKPHGDTGARYLVDRIPAGLWSRAREKAAREGISMRALILTLLDDWTKG